jgi:hypothetical protein
MSKQWTVAAPAGGEHDEAWYYARRTGPDGERVILELHLTAGERHAAGDVHCYVEPDGHTTDDLDGCTVRGTLPARQAYDAWQAAARDNQAAYAYLAEVEVPPETPGMPAHAQAALAERDARIADLQAQLAQAQAGRPRVRRTS